MPANYFPNSFEFRRGSRNIHLRCTLATVRKQSSGFIWKGKKEKKKGNGRKREGEAERNAGSGNNILTLNVATGANFQML